MFFMLKIFKRVLLHSTFSDETATFEKAYRKHKATRVLENSTASIIVILVQQALMIGMSALYYDYKVTVRESVFALITLIIAILKKKLKGWLEHLLFIVSCTVYINGILTLRFEFNNLTSRSIYLQAYFLGVFQQLLMALMFRFQMITLLQLALIGIQCFILTTIDFQSDKELIGEMIVNICLNLVILFVIFYLENNERKMFKKYQNYQMYSPLKRSNSEMLLVRTMPQSMLLLTKNLSKVVFTNDSWERNFNSTRQSVTLPKILESFFINKNHFNIQDKFESLFNEDQTIMNLYIFLEKTFSRKPQELPGDSLVIYTSYMDTNFHNTKILFETTIFTTLHEGEPAIAIILSNATQQKAFLCAKAADASKDKFLATISHELKTPLNGVLGGLNMAIEASRDEETISSLNMSKRSAKLLVSTVNSLLDLHNIRRGNMRLRLFRVQLPKLVEEVESLFESQCAQKGLILHTIRSPDTPTYIHTDKERLSQILINLLTNAVKFTHEGEVTIKMGIDPTSKGNILFEVRDTGVGIKPEDQSKLFTRMYGNDIEEDAVGAQGIGLGLTVSNNLVKMMNRDEEGIQCASEYKKGSTFSFKISRKLIIPNREENEQEDIISFLENVGEQNLELKMTRYGSRKDTPSRNFEFSKLNVSLSPGLKDHEEFLFHHSIGESQEFGSHSKIPKSKTDLAIPSLHFAKPKTRSTGNGMFLFQSKTEGLVGTHLKGWVLLVDDNPFNLMVAQRVIENLGYSVKTADNGEDAIAKAKTQMKDYKEFFKLIVMDCQMPIMDGYEATRQLRKLMLSKEIPSCSIVALTANDTDEDKKRCRESGMDDVLSKPLLEDDILKIKAYLGE